MKKTTFYEAPEAELILVKFEDAFLNGTNGYTEGGGGSYGDDDTNDNGEY